MTELGVRSVDVPASGSASLQDHSTKHPTHGTQVANMMSNTAPSSFFTFSNTINGKSRAAAKETQAINPSNRQRLWQVPVASEEDVDEAVTAATEAFPTWSTTPWQDRAQRLTQAREALVKIHHDMASLIMQENGKPVGNRLRDSCQDMQAKMVL